MLFPTFSYNFRFSFVQTVHIIIDIWRQTFRVFLRIQPNYLQIGSFMVPLCTMKFRCVQLIKFYTSHKTICIGFMVMLRVNINSYVLVRSPLQLFVFIYVRHLTKSFRGACHLGFYIACIIKIKFTMFEMKKALCFFSNM